LTTINAGSIPGCPSIRAKALSRAKISWAVPEHRFFAREVEDQDSGNLTLITCGGNLLPKIVPPTIDSA
jgi:hypothetical protein